ncbi:MAG: hypothetical protein VB137_07085 [Burkholderia sp.]
MLAVPRGDPHREAGANQGRDQAGADEAATADQGEGQSIAWASLRQLSTARRDDRAAACLAATARALAGNESRVAIPPRRALKVASGSSRPRNPAQGETKPSRAFSDFGLPSNSAA